MPPVLPVRAAFRSQADHLDASRVTVNWTLTIKNASETELTEHFVSDIVSVTTPDGVVHPGIHAAMPNITMRIPPRQTVSQRIPVQLGTTRFVDGGVLSSPPAVGAYSFTYVFVDSHGAQTPPTTFILKVQ